MRFTESLDRSVEDIKRPPNLPRGHYIWQVQKHPEQDEIESKKDGTVYDTLTFLLQCVEPTDDVDPDELSEYGNVAGKIERKQFMFHTKDKAKFEQTMFNLRRFLGHLGVDESMQLGEALAASVGARCLGELNHRPDPNDPEIVYTEVGKTAEV